LNSLNLDIDNDLIFKNLKSNDNNVLEDIEFTKEGEKSNYSLKIFLVIIL